MKLKFKSLMAIALFTVMGIVSSSNVVGASGCEWDVGEWGSCTYSPHGIYCELEVIVDFNCTFEYPEAKRQ